MDNSDFSSCSFETEVQIPNEEIHERKGKASEAVILENQRLQEMNKQLQDNIGAIKTQLKDALDAVGKSTNVSQQIQNLRDQLQETLAQKEQLQKQLNEKESDTTNNQKLNEEISKLNNDREIIAQTLIEKESLINKLKKEKQAFKAADVEKTQLIELLSETVQKEKNTKRKQKKQIIALSEELESQKQLLDQTTAQLHQSQDANKKLQNEAEEIKAQLVELTSSYNSAKETINAQETTISQTNNALNSLQKFLIDQKDEFEMFDQQRNSFSTLLAKMNKLTITQQEVIEKLQNENAQLKANQAKPVKRELNALNQTNILQLTMPFDEPIKSSCEKILMLPQYNPGQRLQLILNELSSKIKEYKKENNEYKEKIETLEKQISSVDEDESKFKQVTIALLNELKNIAVTETKIGASESYENDPQFISFVSQQCQKIDPMLANEVTNDPLFVSSDFFSNEDVQAKIKIIQKIIDDDKTIGAIFISQFLVNVVLRNQLKKVVGSLNQYEELSKLSIAHGEDIVDLPEIVKSQKEQIEKLNESRKKMHETIKKFQNARAEELKKDNEQRTQIVNLQLQLDSVERDNEVLKMKIQVLQNEIAIKSQAVVETREINIDTSKEEQMKKQIDSLTTELSKKTEENKELTKTIKNMQKTINDNNAAQQKRSRKVEENHQKQIQELEFSLSSLIEKSQEKKKQVKKNTAALKQQYEESIKQMTNEIEELKKSNEENINELNNKCTESKAENQKLQESVKSLELKCNQMQSIIDDNEQNKKEMEMEMTNLKAAFNKEKQMLQAKLTTSQFNAETQIHERVKSTERKYTERVNAIISSLISTIGEFYEVDESSINEENAHQLLQHAKEDLEKLKYFQTENLMRTEPKKD